MSFATISEANAFHLERLTDGWAAATAETRTAMIVRASDYIEDSFVPKFAWIVDDIVDPRAKRAALVLAGLMLTREAFDPTISESTEELSGVGRVTTKRDLARDPFPQVTAILSPIADRRSATADRRVVSGVMSR